MKQKERAELHAWAAVLPLVERQTAKRHGITVAGLRVLLRVAAMTGTGALIRGTDVARTGISEASNVRAALVYLIKKKLLTIRNGGIISGHYLVTPAGTAITTEFASAWRRSAANLQAFEPASPYRRFTPKK